MLLVVLLVVFSIVWCIDFIPIHISISGKVIPVEAGIKVHLTQNGKFVAETITDSNGNYWFSNLPRDVYGLLFIKGGKVYVYGFESAVGSMETIKARDIINLSSSDFAIVKGGAKPRRVCRRRETAALPDNFCENGRIFAVA